MTREEPDAAKRQRRKRRRRKFKSAREEFELVGVRRRLHCLYRRRAQLLK